MVLHLTVLSSARAWLALVQKKDGADSCSHVKLVAVHIRDATMRLEEDGTLKISCSLGQPRL